MINYKRSSDIRHGVVLKETGEPNVGIFHGSSLPASVDTGDVPDGSIYIRSTGEIWQKKSALWVLMTSGYAQIEYSLLQDIRPLGFYGGTSRKKTWNVRALNTISRNDNNNAALIGDDFTLAPGSYRIQISAPANEVEEHKLRLFNETTGLVEFEGPALVSKSEGSMAFAVGVVVSNGVDLYEVHHYTKEKKEEDGLGEATSIGDVEVYTSVEVFKIGA